MEIDLFGDPPTAKEIETEREKLENSRLLIVQNNTHVAELFHRLLIKAVVIAVILVVVGILYFILPVGIFGVSYGRTVLLVTVSIMLLSSLLWISWRTWNEARSIVPSRGHSIVRLRRVQFRVAELADIDVKLRLNVINWSRSDGVLTEYVKKVTRQHRSLIALEYRAVRKFIDKSAGMKPTL
ncbi:MAG: hypothetical protein GXP23_05735 [Gammaproteobacteria bacterium]|nr:hypothetical protein [Gammaproteobacteria bacterium]